MLAKLYAITILAMFNNRVVLQHSVASSALGMVNMEGGGMVSPGSPTPLGLRSGENSMLQTFESASGSVRKPEIRIGRSVVQQIWTDDTVEIKHRVSLSGFLTRAYFDPLPCTFPVLLFLADWRPHP